MIEGEPEADAWSMDVARYGRWAENKRYIRETTGQFYSRRFVMTYPNEQLPAGRPLKMAPATKYGGKMVVCQPGTTPRAKSQETTL